MEWAWNQYISFSFWWKYLLQVLTELWNGTNWTEVNDLNTARRQLGAGTGTQLH